MLLRRMPEQVVAIAQPAHAWIAGQLAAQWGNEGFARPAAFADWCLATAIHDLGWAAWEFAPTRDAASGWPQEFWQVSPLIHVDLWRVGVSRAGLFGSYAALLVSRHADTIYGRHIDRAALAPPIRELVDAFLDEQHALQAALVSALAEVEECRLAILPEAIEHARLALATVDELLLALCWGVAEPRELVEVPRAPGDLTRLTLRPGPRLGTATLAPWPFGSDRVTVGCDGRVLDQPATSDQELRERLRRAPLTRVETTLLPG